jgi:hypothetical protein
MTLKHTPGPWTTDVHGFIYAAPDSELPDRTNQGASIVVAKVLKHSSGRPIANARLISAAPDLLAALQIMVNAANVAEIDPLVMFASIEKARAAISKATGE